MQTKPSLDKPSIRQSVRQVATSISRRQRALSSARPWPTVLWLLPLVIAATCGLLLLYAGLLKSLPMSVSDREVPSGRPVLKADNTFLQIVECDDLQAWARQENVTVLEATRMPARRFGFNQFGVRFRRNSP